ncbi:heavy-metal-associated domain-containing protein [Prosthecobacter sp.]|uniref:heavy-metal-associated domain-containing protein n=1 Tax=Prosthecobacter sp. TaxID=1965333 RepID=UPI003783A948
MMKHLILIFSLTALHLHADESKHRLIGLSEPSREQDLRDQVKTLPEVEVAALNMETGEVTFRYDVTKLITNYNAKKPPAPEAVTKRLEDLLRAASNGTFTLVPLSTLPADKLQKIQIQCGLLDCKGCRYAAYIAVAKLDGVEHASVNEHALLTVMIDPAKTNRAALEEALKKGRIELKPL